MENKKKTILIPWGLTAFSEYAFQYALQIAKVVDNDIAILRIISNLRDQKDIEEDLNKEVDELNKKYNYKPKIIFREGKINKVIAEIAEEENTNLFIKHVGQIRGIEHIMGSKTLNMISYSKAPFIVIHKPPQQEDFSKIVCPIDYTGETKQKARWAVYLAKYYKVKIQIFASQTSFKEINHKTKLNILGTINFFDSKGVQYEVEYSDEKIEFIDSITEYANKIQADLIMIMMSKIKRGLLDITITSKEESIINNKYQIPVMCINPRMDLKARDYSL